METHRQWKIMDILTRCSILLSVFYLTAGSGDLEIKFIALENAQNMLDNGTPCDNGICRVKMKVPFSEPSQQTFTTKYFDNFDKKLTFPAKLNTGASIKFDNPQLVPFSDTISAVAADILITDHSHGRKEPMCKLRLDLHVTTGLLYNQTLASTYCNLSVSVKVHCEKNYYKDCGVHCAEKADNVHGYFRCDRVTGEKVCRSGWAGDVCKTRTCPSTIDIKHGYVVAPSPQYLVNDTIEFGCDADYRLSGGVANTSTCTKAGSWSEQRFGHICVAIPRCREMIGPENSMISYEDERRGVGSRARISCVPDKYCLVGGRTVVTCMGTGQWGAYNATCQIGCEQLPTPAYGMISYNILNACGNPGKGATVAFRCTAPYKPIWSRLHFTCGTAGAWNVFGSPVHPRDLAFLCIPDSDNDNSVEVASRRRSLVRSAVIIGIGIGLLFLSISLAYYWAYKRRERQMELEFKAQDSVVPENPNKFKNLSILTPPVVRPQSVHISECQNKDNFEYSNPCFLEDF